MKKYTLVTVLAVLALIVAYFVLSQGGDAEIRRTDEGAGISSPIQARERITQGDARADFMIPDGWRHVRESEASSDLYGPASTAAIERGDLTTPPDIVVALIQNSAGKSLEAFVANYGNGWFLNYSEMRAASVDDHIALMFSDASSTIARSPERAAFVSLGSHIVVITAEQSAAPVFEEILATLDLVP